MTKSPTGIWYNTVSDGRELQKIESLSWQSDYVRVSI